VEKQEALDQYMNELASERKTLGELKEQMAKNQEDYDQKLLSLQQSIQRFEHCMPRLPFSPNSQLTMPLSLTESKETLSREANLNTEQLQKEKKETEEQLKKALEKSESLKQENDAQSQRGEFFFPLRILWS